MQGMGALRWRDAGAADAQAAACALARGGQPEAGAASTVPALPNAWASKGNVNSSFVLTPASGEDGGRRPPGSPTVERVCCLWYAWIFCPCFHNQRCHMLSRRSFTRKSKACSQTFQGRESLAKDLLPLILQ